MKNKKFCIKIRAWVWEYSDENFEKSKLQKEIKKLLTSLDGYGILLKLSLRDKRKTEKFDLERRDSSKKNLKKFLTNASGFDILNKLLMSS